MQRDIHLTDPAGGGFTQSGAVLTVKHKNIRVVASVDLDCAFNPGELRVTQMAFDKLGVPGVVAAFTDHLAEKWWNPNKRDRRDNSIAARRDQDIYNVDRARGIAIITYPSDNSTLIDTVEY